MQQRVERATRSNEFTADLEHPTATQLPDAHGEWQNLDCGVSGPFVGPHVGDIVSNHRSDAAKYHWLDGPSLIYPRTGDSISADDDATHSYCSYLNSDVNPPGSLAGHLSMSESITPLACTSSSDPQSQRINDSTLYDGSVRRHPYLRSHSLARALSPSSSSIPPRSSSMHIVHQQRMYESSYHGPTGHRDMSSSADANMDSRNVDLGTGSDGASIQIAATFRDGLGSPSDEWTLSDSNAQSAAQLPTEDIHRAVGSTMTISDLAVNIAAAGRTAESLDETLYQQWYEEIRNLNQDGSGHKSYSTGNHPSLYSYPYPYSTYPTHLLQTGLRHDTPFTSSHAPLSSLALGQQWRPQSGESSATSVAPATLTPTPIPAPSAALSSLPLLSESSSSLPISQAPIPLLPLHAPRPTRLIEIARFDLTASSETESSEES